MNDCSTRKTHDKTRAKLRKQEDVCCDVHFVSYHIHSHMKCKRRANRCFLVREDQQNWA